MIEVFYTMLKKREQKISFGDSWQPYKHYKMIKLFYPAKYNRLVKLCI